MSSFFQEHSYSHPKQQQPAFPLPRLSPGITDPPTVLVVDDDSVFRQLEARALSEDGYNVLEADCADEALRLAGATANVKLLLTDFHMPGADGVELAREFRTIHPSAPVLMVSGSSPAITDRVKDLDRFAVLEKSANFEELLEKVRTLLAEVTPLPF
jgi:DNA-binding response OmpR family regulator